jgi:transcriptional regulator with XRE-family HTH domain
MRFEKVLKEKREARGLSIEELSVKTGITESSLQKFEEGTMLPNLESFVEISKALSVLPNDLLVGVEFQKNKSYDCMDNRKYAEKIQTMSKEAKIKHVQYVVSAGKEINVPYLQRKYGFSYEEAVEMVNQIEKE